jgi:hypothetical protein
MHRASASAPLSATHTHTHSAHSQTRTCADHQTRKQADAGGRQCSKLHRRRCSSRASAMLHAALSCAVTGHGTSGDRARVCWPSACSTPSLVAVQNTAACSMHSLTAGQSRHASCTLTAWLAGPRCTRAQAPARPLCRPPLSPLPTNGHPSLGVRRFLQHAISACTPPTHAHSAHRPHGQASQPAQTRCRHTNTELRHTNSAMQQHPQCAAALPCDTEHSIRSTHDCLRPPTSHTSAPHGFSSMKGRHEP